MRSSASDSGTRGIKVEQAVQDCRFLITRVVHPSAAVLIEELKLSQSGAVAGIVRAVFPHPPLAESHAVGGGENRGRGSITQRVTGAAEVSSGPGAIVDRRDAARIVNFTAQASDGIKIGDLVTDDGFGSEAGPQRDGIDLGEPAIDDIAVVEDPFLPVRIPRGVDGVPRSPPQSARRVEAGDKGRSHPRVDRDKAAEFSEQVGPEATNHEWIVVADRVIDLGDLPLVAGLDGHEVLGIRPMHGSQLAREFQGPGDDVLIEVRIVQGPCLG